MTIREAVRKAKSCLAESHVPDAETDAILLLQSVCGIDRARYYACMDEELEGADGYLEKVGLRAARIPLQQITGEQYFCGLRFQVTEDVLCPRPETELLVEEALKRLKTGDRFLDLCTGSGCIAISILCLGNELSGYDKDVPGREEDAGFGCLNLTGYGCDLSDKALEVAAGNAISNDTLDCLGLSQGDLYSAVSGTFDMIVSNPPYIRSDEIGSLMEEVRDHEPRMALDGGTDGLDFYRRILEGASEHLNKDGWLLVEIGYEQADAVRSMFVDHGFRSVCVRKDLAGLDRIVLGQRGD